MMRNPAHAETEDCDLHIVWAGPGVRSGRPREKGTAASGLCVTEYPAIRDSGNISRIRKMVHGTGVWLSRLFV
jgi:hypothetical protein